MLTAHLPSGYVLVRVAGIQAEFIPRACQIAPDIWEDKPAKAA